MNTFEFSQTLITTLILCGSLSLLSTPAFADGGIRVHRANQFNHFKSKQHNKHQATSHFKNKHHSHYKYYHHSQQPPVPDSRFPNSYQNYSYYQKLQSQQHRHH